MSLSVQFTICCFLAVASGLGMLAMLCPRSIAGLNCETERDQLKDFLDELEGDDSTTRHSRIFGASVIAAASLLFMRLL